MIARQIPDAACAERGPGPDVGKPSDDYRFSTPQSGLHLGCSCIDRTSLPRCRVQQHDAQLQPIVSTAPSLSGCSAAAPRTGFAVRALLSLATPLAVAPPASTLMAASSAPAPAPAAAGASSISTSLAPAPSAFTNSAGCSAGLAAGGSSAAAGERACCAAGAGAAAGRGGGGSVSSCFPPARAGGGGRASCLRRESGGGVLLREVPLLHWEGQLVAWAAQNSCQHVSPTASTV